MLIINKLKFLEAQVNYFSIPGSVACVSHKCRNSGKMASDALLVVSIADLT